MFDRVINLDSIIEDARNGGFENEREITILINKHIAELRETRRATIKAFHESSNCTHENTSEPFYQLQRRVMGYVLVFQKSCNGCGKKFHETCGEDSPYNEKNPPKGYEGATERYYNNNI